MSTHYIENASSGSQYYFNANTTSTSSSSQPYNSSGYVTYPTNLSGSRSPNQQIRIENSYHSPSPQQYQSVAGFNKTSAQQYYQTPASPPAHLRPTVRAISSQDQYNLQRSIQPLTITPQQHHFQFDTRQQTGQPTGPAVVYQTPGAAQFTHRNVDLWTEGSPSPRGQDQYVQAQRVSVRSVSTGSPQQSYSVSPQRQQQDRLQQYYSQLTPEQHQQLLRQQQLQRQQEQNSHYEEKQKIITQSISPSTQQHRSTAGFTGGQQYQQGRGRSDSERQRQDEQDYYTAQRQMAAQRVQQGQEDPSSHPVGIRNLMNKFAGPAPTPKYQPSRSKSQTSRHYSSSSSYTNTSGPTKTTTQSFTSNTMTYSALPKPHEPPVNSAEYYQMLQSTGTPFTNIQQAVAPQHIQHHTPPTAFNSLRDRFKTGSLSEDFYRPPPPPQQQQQPAVNRQQQQQQVPQSPTGSNLSSLRNQYMNRAKQASVDEQPSQPLPHIPRTIVGEDLPQEKPQTKISPPKVQPPVSVQQAPEKSAAPEPAAQNSEPVQSQAADQQAPSSEVTSPPADAEGVSSF